MTASQSLDGINQLGGGFLLCDLRVATRGSRQSLQSAVYNSVSEELTSWGETNWSTVNVAYNSGVLLRLAYCAHGDGTYWIEYGNHLNDPNPSYRKPFSNLQYMAVSWSQRTCYAWGSKSVVAINLDGLSTKALPGNVTLEKCSLTNDDGSLYFSEYARGASGWENFLVHITKQGLQRVAKMPYPHVVDMHFHKNNILFTSKPNKLVLWDPLHDVIVWSIETINLKICSQYTNIGLILMYGGPLEPALHDLNNGSVIKHLGKKFRALKDCVALGQDSVAALSWKDPNGYRLKVRSIF